MKLISDNNYKTKSINRQYPTFGFLGWQLACRSLPHNARPEEDSDAHFHPLQCGILTDWFCQSQLHALHWSNYGRYDDWLQCTLCPDLRKSSFNQYFLNYWF